MSLEQKKKKYKSNHKNANKGFKYNRKSKRRVDFNLGDKRIEYIIIYIHEKADSERTVK